MTVSDDILKAFATLATPTIANALDDVAFEGVMQGLGQIVPGTRCVGRAITVRETTGKRGDFTSAEFKVGDMIEAASPGDIIVIDNGGHCVSTWGGLATLAAKLKGVGGLVADSGVRDREEMLEHRLPVFARHMTPLTGRTRLAITAINVPVCCGGVLVRPGDVIVGDGGTQSPMPYPSGRIDIGIDHLGKRAMCAQTFVCGPEVVSRRPGEWMTKPHSRTDVE